MALLSPSAIAKAHKIAQKNAEELLGLAPDNTALDRAKALGFDVDNPVYHGTYTDIEKIDPSKLGLSTHSKSAKKAFWTVDNPKTAEGYANYSAMDAKVDDLINKSKIEEEANKFKLSEDLMRQAELLEQEFFKNQNQGQTIIPLVVSKKNQSVLDADGSTFMDFQEEMHNVLDQAKEHNYSSVKIKNLSDEIDWSNHNPATHYGILNPSSVRSKFAVFDPKKLGIGAGSVMSADLLANEINQAQSNDKSLSKYGMLTPQEGDVLQASKPNPVLKYMADSYKYASDQGGLLGNILYEGGAKALDDLAYGTTPMQKVGRLNVPTPEATLNLMNLLQL